jgi:4-oxalocrotonate tautomerase
MPYVNIKVTREGVTASQKAELIEGVASLLAGVLGKNPATTVVVIEEVDTDNWGIGGESVTVRRGRGQGLRRIHRCFSDRGRLRPDDRGCFGAVGGQGKIIMATLRHGSCGLRD